ncbi:MAG: hypothetical protein OHK003_12710 [Anaerolineales bacterium]
MKHRRNLIVGVVLTAAVTTAILTTVSAPGHDSPGTETASSAPITESPIPAADSAEFASQGSCVYQWAHKDAPELTASFDKFAKTINPKASGRVEYFGENCAYANGTKTFLAMETDFYVRFQVENLAQEETFGDWVGQVMEHVVQLPREELQGPNYGFVEFRFEINEVEHIVFRAPIQKYLDEAQGKTGAELLRIFHTP